MTGGPPLLRAFWDQDRNGQNFGDALNPYLLARLAGIALVWAEPERAQLFAIGSIVEAIPAGFSGYVLGSGLMFEGSRRDLRAARVLALRGPLTAERCEVAPPVLADLGLLAPLLIEQTPERDVALGWLPHYVDRRVRAGRMIDVLAPPAAVVAAVARCQRLETSSLHGMIAADALGIPSRWIPHRGVLGTGFKFRDYAASYGATIEPYAWRQAPRDEVAAKQRELLDVIRELSAEVQA